MVSAFFYLETKRGEPNRCKLFSPNTMADAAKVSKGADKKHEHGWTGREIYPAAVGSRVGRALLV
jgi:hypothetical protein